MYGPSHMNVPAGLPGLDFLELDLEEDDGVLAEGAEHEDDAGDHPRLDRRQTLSLHRSKREVDSTG